MSQKAELIIKGKKYELDIFTGTDGRSGIDISNLYKETGYVAVDPGFFNTAVGNSRVSRRDASEGTLTYRGYDVGDLVKNSTFVETAYLLIYGDLPKKEQLTDFSKRLSKHSLIHEDMVNLFDGFPGKAHPLAVLSTMVMSLSSYYSEEYEESIDKGVDQVSRLLAKVRTISAFSYKKMIGQPFIYPLDRLPYCSNFLHMLFSVPAESYNVDPYYEKLLNQLWILYAEHEQNVAATTVQLVGSTKANLFASISAGISALWGSREGGQSVAAVELLEEILENNGDFERIIEEMKNSDMVPTFIGHSAYEKTSPRALVAREIFKEFCGNYISPILDVAKKVENYFLNDPYFIERNLYPNLEFYSGVMFYSMGIPKNMFTLMQAIGKLPGWLAHWRELRVNNNYKKARPRQIYTGEMNRKYVGIDKR
ncbi:MAG: citrate synthase [Leptospiraceae bacterium]|nr:citrate synthase [Leptospiraceae bacterium]MCP5513043.1 citrate synthase [Leptospiraceae bacterium]